MMHATVRGHSGRVMDNYKLKTHTSETETLNNRGGLLTIIQEINDLRKMMLFLSARTKEGHNNCKEESDMC